MTMVAVCRFRDDAVVVADSRATWLDRGGVVAQDSLQKIIALGSRIALAYAGDVGAAEFVIRQLRQRLRRNTPRAIYKLAADMPRISRHYFRLYTSKRRASSAVAFVLAGVTDEGIVRVWSYESPLFESRPLERGVLAIGSGAFVLDFLRRNFDGWNRDLPDLKRRADAMSIGLEGELDAAQDDTMGGMLQVIMLDRTGVRPLRRGFMDLNPLGPARAKSMRMEAGRWIQLDDSLGVASRLDEPAGVLKRGPVSLRFHDFRKSSEEPCWHLIYFLTCLQAKIDSGSYKFSEIMSSVGGHRFPINLPIIVALGVWGSPGDHEVVLKLVKDGMTQEVGRTRLRIEFNPEGADLAIPITLMIASPGISFLECWIEHQLVARRALYFAQVERFTGSNMDEYREFVRLVETKVLSEQSAQSDPKLVSTGDAALVYFCVCFDCIDQGTELSVERHILVVYSKTYPSPLRCKIASSFRMTPGTHRLHIDLVDVATRKATRIAGGEFSARSSCDAVPIHGELVVPIPHTGTFFVNAYVDDKLTGVGMLVAESDKPSFSYTLLDEHAAIVAAGEQFVLVRGSKPAGEPSAI